MGLVRDFLECLIPQSTDSRGLCFDSYNDERLRLYLWESMLDFLSVKIEFFLSSFDPRVSSILGGSIAKNGFVKGLSLVRSLYEQL